METQGKSYNRDAQRIAQWFKTVRFRRALFGLSEKDVWKKLDELNDMYKRAIMAERVRCDALIEERCARLEAELRGASDGEGGVR